MVDQIESCHVSMQVKNGEMQTIRRNWRANDESKVQYLALLS